jgi:hypothetical protein
MNGHGRLLTRTWLIPVAVIALIAAHAVGFRYLPSGTILSTALVSGLVILVVIKHVGLAGSVYAFFRRRSRPGP